MANKKVLLKRSNVIENGAPKLPTAAQLEYGELAMNYADGYETLSFKNSNNDVVTFESSEKIKSYVDVKVSEVTHELSDAFVPGVYPEDTGDASFVKTSAGDDLDTAVGNLDQNIGTLVEVILENEEVTAMAMTRIKEGIGLDENGNYVADTTATYIKNAKNLSEADKALDDAIKEIAASTGSDVNAVKDYVDESLANYQPKLSAGNGISIDASNVITCTLDTTLYNVVSELPENGESNKIYLVSNETSGTQNVYNEWAYVNGAWEKLGEYKAEINLTPYLTKDEASTTYLTKADAENQFKALSETDTELDEAIKKVAEDLAASPEEVYVGETAPTGDVLPDIFVDTSVEPISVEVYTKEEIDTKVSSIETNVETLNEEIDGKVTLKISEDENNNQITELMIDATSDTSIEVYTKAQVDAIIAQLKADNGLK